MSETTEVRLHGAWGSAHAAMARNALVLKGVQYEYVEEDLDDKSQALLRPNPVHGKVPVLVVDGRLLAESLVIIEYVDEEFHNAVAAAFSFAHSLENADGEQVHTIQTNRTSPIPAAQGATSETDQQHQHTTPTPTTRGQGPATTSAQHSLTQTPLQLLMAAMSETTEVRLHGAWGSAHAAMARNALALKGVQYEYVEEDLDNKSEALLRLNPVHGKVPVLVVDGRLLAESLVIIEYVDEAWPESRGYPPALLPREPRSRAAARFWARFFHDEVSPLSRPVVFADGEAERGELVREMKARMAVMEAGIAEDFPSGEGPFVHGRSPGLLDVILGSCAAGTRVLSAVSGEEIVDPWTMPRVHASVAAFDQLAAGYGTTVPHEHLLARLLQRKARPRAAAA